MDMSQSERRLFYMQGDYGLFQCSKPRCAKTYAAIYRITAALPPAGCLVTSNTAREASLSHPPHEK